MFRKISRLIVPYCLLLSSCSLYAQSPGGIGRQSVWFQGNFSSDPAQDRTLNFNPATNMDGMSKRISMPGNIENLRRATIFTVYQSAELDQDRLVWQINGGFGDLSLSSRQVSSTSEKMNMVFERKEAGSSKIKKPETTISTYLRRQGPSSENAGDKKVDIQFGNPASSQLAGQSSGMIAEFIVYETILKEKEIARIETYLALKYGVTLEKNYLNSLGETIWNREKEKLYSNNIAGIGRDDQSTLFQKQGTSSSSSDQLTIGIDKIALTNASNKGKLNDGDYLIWGDNAQDFTLNRSEAPGESDILLSERKWLMKSSGRNAGTISTELKIDTKTLLPAFYPKENFYLVIDRSGSGDFIPKNCTYIIAESISADGIASFSGVHWDTDGSRKDVFSFGVKASVSADVPANAGASKLLSFHINPNPVTDGNYNIAVKLDKPADINIQVYDLQLHLIESKKATGQANYLLPGKINAAAGVYIVRLFTPGKEFQKIVIKQ